MTKLEFIYSNSSNMVTLEGEESFNSWRADLLLRLDYLGFRKYIESDSTTNDKSGSASEPDDYQELTNKSLVILLIDRSLSDDVKKTLRSCGWDPTQRDPKGTYDSIVALFSSTSPDRIADLVHEWRSLSIGSDLQRYINRVKYLKKRLTELDVEINDSVATHFVLCSIRDYDRSWYDRLQYRAFEMKDLPWLTLLRKVQEKASSTTARLGVNRTNITGENRGRNRSKSPAVPAPKGRPQGHPFVNSQDPDLTWMWCEVEQRWHSISMPWCNKHKIHHPYKNGCGKCNSQGGPNKAQQRGGQA
ncbi:hypothetical protein GGR54DRAFT_613244 [Hypoxylon sp. NC1633]|nr:hypothetical protein GGR54DRAFT_613244 [Hypoxylon sp. NC1633]